MCVKFFGEKLAQYVTINHSQEFRAAETKSWQKNADRIRAWLFGVPSRRGE